MFASNFHERFREQIRRKSYLYRKKGQLLKDLKEVRDLREESFKSYFKDNVYIIYVLCTYYRIFIRLVSKKFNLT